MSTQWKYMSMYYSIYLLIYRYYSSYILVLLWIHRLSSWNRFIKRQWIWFVLRSHPLFEIILCCEYFHFKQRKVSKIHWKQKICDFEFRVSVIRKQHIFWLTGPYNRQNMIVSAELCQNCYNCSQTLSIRFRDWRLNTPMASCSLLTAAESLCP